jgi:GntR family transcriptional regulator
MAFTPSGSFRPAVNETPVRHSSLSAQILAILVRQIRSGAYPPGTLLPPENQLAAEYKVSRATIRSALDQLEALGLITRRQGIGTFVRHISNISNLLNHFIEFIQLIADNGFQPGFEQLRTELVEPTPEQVEMFKLDPPGKLLEIEKVFLADGDPIIYCLNQIPGWVFQQVFSDEHILQPGVTVPILEFLEGKCGQSIAYYLSCVRADIARNCRLPKKFKRVEAYTPVLVIDEMGYNQAEQPVHRSIEYHPGNRMEFKLIRSRNGT